MPSLTQILNGLTSFANNAAAFTGAVKNNSITDISTHTNILYAQLAALTVKDRDAAQSLLEFAKIVVYGREYKTLDTEAEAAAKKKGATAAKDYLPAWFITLHGDEDAARKAATKIATTPGLAPAQQFTHTYGVTAATGNRTSQKETSKNQARYTLDCVGANHWTMDLSYASLHTLVDGAVKNIGPAAQFYVAFNNLYKVATKPKP